MATLTRSKLIIWIARHVVPAGLAAASVLLILGYLFVFRPEFTQINAADRVAVLQEEVRSKGDYLTKLNALEAQYKSFNAEDVDRIRQMIPKEGDVPGILALLEAAATASDLQLVSVNFAAGDTIGLPEVPGLTAINVVISVQHGDYGRFKLFLGSLEESLRLFDVRSVNLDPSHADYTLTIRTYAWVKPTA